MAIITGSSGNNRIIGTVDDDTIYANAGPGSGPVDGDDRVYALLGNDKVFGAAGNDILNGGAGNDTVFGGEGTDKIFGGADNDSVYGGLGDDSVLGGAGDDRVFGNDGNDRLNGGEGNDTMFGGAGADTFNFRSGEGSDVVNDLHFSDGDNLFLGAFGLGASAVVDSIADIKALADAELVGVKIDGNDLAIEFTTGQCLLLRGLAAEYSDLLPV